MTCDVCSRVTRAQAGKNPEFVAQLKSGYVFLHSGRQDNRGYALFTSADCVPELHFLRPTRRRLFLWEMSLVAHASYLAFAPVKMNYALLGNTVSHLHWHIIPRHANDPDPTRPIWEGARRQPPTKIPANELGLLRDLFLPQIEKVARHNVVRTFREGLN